MSALGKDFRFYLREQTDFTTGATLGLAEKWHSLPLFSWTPQPQQQRNQDGVLQAGAPTSQPGALVDGLSSFAWSARVPAGLQSAGWWLRQTFGAAAITDNDPNFTHQFRTVDAPTIPSFSVQGFHSTTGVNRRFIAIGCFVNTLTINASRVGERLALDLSGFGISENKTSTTADTDPIIYTGDDAPVQFLADFYIDTGSGSTQLAGIVTNLSATVSNGVVLDEAPFNGLPTPTLRTAPRWSAEGQLTIRFLDYTLYDLAVAGTPITIEVRFVSGANNRLNLIFKDVKLDKFGVPVEGEEVLSATVRFVAGKVSSGNSVTYRLDSQVEDYAPVAE